MKKLHFIVSLITEDNDFQKQQAIAAQEAAHGLDVDIQVLYAENDGVLQSQQLLKAIQSNSEPRCDGIIFEAAGATDLPQVARAAAAAGIGWGILNRQADYIQELRRNYKVPIFSVASNHAEIGHTQAHQLAALLPHGGSALYIEGPSQQAASKERTAGVTEAKPGNVSLRAIRGQWTEESGYRTVTSWLRLSTSQQAHFDVVAAQNDEMAMGARKAFQEIAHSASRLRWLNLPFLGCDGLPKTGQAWVNSGLLAATIISLPMAGQAVEMMTKALRTGINPPHHSLVSQESYPSVQALASSKWVKEYSVPAGAV